MRHSLCIAKIAHAHVLCMSEPSVSGGCVADPVARAKGTAFEGSIRSPFPKGRNRQVVSTWGNVIDLVALRIDDVAPPGSAIDRANVRQRKTGRRRARFELTEQTRPSLDAYLRNSGRKPRQILPGTRHRSSSDDRHCARPVARWVASGVPGQGCRALQVATLPPTSIAGGFLFLFPSSRTVPDEGARLTGRLVGVRS
jgi:hypothetical protein